MPGHTGLPVRAQLLEMICDTGRDGDLDGYRAVTVGELQPLTEVGRVVVLQQQMTDDCSLAGRNIRADLAGYVVPRHPAEMLVAVIRKSELNPASRVSALLRPGILGDFLVNEIMFGDFSLAEPASREDGRRAAGTCPSRRKRLQDTGRYTPPAVAARWCHLYAPFGKCLRVMTPASSPRPDRGIAHGDVERYHAEDRDHPASVAGAGRTDPSTGCHGGGDRRNVARVQDGD